MPFTQKAVAGCVTDRSSLIQVFKQDEINGDLYARCSLVLVYYGKPAVEWNIHMTAHFNGDVYVCVTVVALPGAVSGTQILSILGLINVFNGDASLKRSLV